MINSMLTLLDLSNMHTHILDVAVVVMAAAAATTTETGIIKAYTTFSGSEDKL